MADTPEHKVKRRIATLLAEHHVNTPATGGFGKSGQLDFVCCIHGRYVAIEAKSVDSPYGKRGPTQLQWDEIDSIRTNGGVALVIDETNIELLRQVLHALTHGVDSVALHLATQTLTRFTRPTLTPSDTPAPTKRNRNVRPQ